MSSFFFCIIDECAPRRVKNSIFQTKDQITFCSSLNVNNVDLTWELRDMKYTLDIYILFILYYRKKVTGKKKIVYFCPLGYPKTMAYHFYSNINSQLVDS